MTKEELERKLGQLTYQIGKQQKILEEENNKLRKLHQQANNVATEIEELEQRDNP